MLFINASENIDGNTVKMAKTLLSGQDYDQLNLKDYRVYQIGQSFDNDQFDQVLESILKNDSILFGTPTYWHDISGYLKTLLERLSQSPLAENLQGKKIYLILQGFDPTDAKEQVELIFKRFASALHMEFVRMATNKSELKTLTNKL